MKPDWYVDPSIEERDPFVFDLMKAYKVRMVRGVESKKCLTEQERLRGLAERLCLTVKRRLVIYGTA
jgi:hypothetical protein